MKVLVCGGREYGNWYGHRDHVTAVLDKLPVAMIIQGGASGADLLAHQWAKKRQLPSISHFADWEKHGKMAGPIRNGEMLDMWKPDQVVAFPGGMGTENMVRQAQARGISVQDEREVPS